MSAGDHLNPEEFGSPRLFNPGSEVNQGTPFFHFSERDVLDPTHPGELHGGTRRAAEQHAQARFHQGSIHQVSLRPDAPTFNTPDSPATDSWANAVASTDEDIARMYGNYPEDRKDHGAKAIFYANEAEDPGSTSVVGPASAFEYHGAEPHTPVKITDSEYHTKTEYGRGREGIGIQRPGVNLQTKLFGAEGQPSPYVVGMPPHGRPAGKSLR